MPNEQHSAAPQSATPWWTIRRPAAKAEGDDAKPAPTEVWIYGDIGESWFGDTVAAKDLVKEIAAIDATELAVRINSYGGSVSDGLAIHNALRYHAAHVTVHIDGVAASIASLIAMAGDTVEIASNARLMVHAPWAVAVGNAEDMRTAADMLDGWAKSMSSSYARKTGKPVDDVMGWLTDGRDHWFGADDAVANGLADTVTDALPVAASASAFTWAAATRAAQATKQARQALQPVGPTPAAAAAQPEPETLMSDKTTAANTDQVQAAADAARAAEAARQSGIRTAAKPLAALKIDGLDALVDKACADTTITVEGFKSQALDLHAKGVEPVAGAHVTTVADEVDKQRGAITSALAIRAGLAKNDGANPWRARSLLQVAEASLKAAGVREADMPGDKLTMVALAFTHGGSDFPNIVANVAQKAMLKGYEEQPETFDAWTNKGSLPDFKQARSVDLGSIGSLRKVLPGAEYKYVTFGERGQVYALSTYGELFGINRQTIINDDVGAFTAIPRKMGRAARRTVGDLVYAQLTSNPVMPDSVALFHATHGNLQAASGVSTTSVDQMRTAMALQKDAGQTSGALNIDLAFLLVPKALDGASSVVRDSEYEVGASTRNNTVPNSQRNRFQVISDARLDAASSTIWYGAASPAMADTVTVFYLDGNESPFLDQQNGWSRDGVEFKVRMDAAASAMDFRGLQRNG